MEQALREMLRECFGLVDVPKYQVRLFMLRLHTYQQHHTNHQQNQEDEAQNETADRAVCPRGQE